VQQLSDVGPQSVSPGPLDWQLVAVATATQLPALHTVVLPVQSPLVRHSTQTAPTASQYGLDPPQSPLDVQLATHVPAAHVGVGPEHVVSVVA
jgi:hypothetical protein